MATTRRFAKDDKLLKIRGREGTGRAALWILLT